ncbi:hypothetical protein EDF58_11074 [Novosphingobium sp. PhB57]|jgi:hypothetical protein|nr:hypothetical protein EDF58_11074 [Novosphingobium sp. PhB57]
MNKSLHAFAHCFALAVLAALTSSFAISTAVGPIALA